MSWYFVHFAKFGCQCSKCHSLNACSHWLEDAASARCIINLISTKVWVTQAVQGKKCKLQLHSSSVGFARIKAHAAIPLSLWDKCPSVLLYHDHSSVWSEEVARSQCPKQSWQVSILSRPDTCVFQEENRVIFGPLRLFGNKRYRWERQLAFGNAEVTHVVLICGCLQAHKWDQKVQRCF